MNKTIRKFVYLGLGAFCMALLANPAMADRGGWADPEGGWTFVEEWADIPAFDGDPDWNHNNGSDEYSGNAHTDLFGQEVVRIDSVAGVGDTEDGENPATDATVLTLVDLGDPRGLGISDPSDRKLYFLAPLHEPDFAVFDQFPDLDPFKQGLTFAARFRIFPLPIDETIQNGDSELVIPDTLGPGDTLQNIPEASDRAHIGLGFVDPGISDFRVIVGCGYYNPDSIELLVDTPDGEDDGTANPKIVEGISNTEFHSIWITAEADPEDDLRIIVKAYVDGSLEPVEGVINRLSGDLPNPEELQDNPEWEGFPELSINLGSAGTTAIGAFQYDWVAASIEGAFEPTEGAFSPGGGTSVPNWSLF